jgi:hypothetical protein
MNRSGQRAAAPLEFATISIAFLSLFCRAHSLPPVRGDALMSSGRRLGLVLIGLLLSATIGCEPGFVFPTLCDPRSESQKLAQARKFDPYPDPTVGGDMTGARPRDFTNPRPDPDASKLQTRGPWPDISRPPAYPPAPAIYGAPPTSSPPGAVYSPAGVVYPPAGTAYPPPSTTIAPPLGTTSNSIPPVQNGAPPLAPIAGVPATPGTAATSAAYGEAINAPP